MVLDHSFGAQSLSRDNVSWPGSGHEVRVRIVALHDEWRALLQAVTDQDLRSTSRTRWPFADRPFADVVSWVNVELSKNAAEIGYARFLYAAR